MVGIGITMGTFKISGIGSKVQFFLFYKLWFIGKNELVSKVF